MNKRTYRKRNHPSPPRNDEIAGYMIISLLVLGVLIQLVKWLLDALKDPLFFRAFWFLMIASIAFGAWYVVVRYKAKRNGASISAYLCRRAYLDGENGFVVPKSRNAQNVIADILLEEVESDLFFCENTADIDLFANRYKEMLEKLEKLSMLDKSTVTIPANLDYQRATEDFQWRCCDAIKRAKDFKIYEIKEKYKNSREFQEKALEQFKEKISGLQEDLSEYTKKYAADAVSEIEQLLFPEKTANVETINKTQDGQTTDQVKKDTLEGGGSKNSEQAVTTLPAIQVTQEEHLARVKIVATPSGAESAGKKRAGTDVSALSSRTETANGEADSIKADAKETADQRAAEEIWRKEKLWAAPVAGLKGMEFPIGKDSKDELVKADLSQINHLFIAGASGTGKSVFLDTMIRSLIFNNSSQDVRFILCDTKIVDFAPFNGTPNLLMPVVSDHSRISGILEWAVMHGMKRLETFSSVKAKSISSYNDQAWEKFDAELPKIVLIIDDIAEVLQVSQNAKDNIRRILSIGWQAGIHLILSTKTPATKHLKEIIPQFFSKMAFQMSSPSELQLLAGKKKGLPAILDIGEALYCTGTVVTTVHTISS